MQMLMAQTGLKPGHLVKLQRRLQMIDLRKLSSASASASVSPSSTPPASPTRAVTGSTTGEGSANLSAGAGGGAGAGLLVPLSTETRYTWLISQHADAARAWREGRQLTAMMIGLGLGRYIRGFVHAMRHGHGHGHGYERGGINSNGGRAIGGGNGSEEGSELEVENPNDGLLHELLQQSAMAVEQLCKAAHMRAGHSVKLRTHLQRA